MTKVFNSTVGDNQNTHFMSNIVSENCAVYEMVTKITVELDTP